MSTSDHEMWVSEEELRLLRRYAGTKPGTGESIRRIADSTGSARVTISEVIRRFLRITLPK